MQAKRYTMRVPIALPKGERLDLRTAESLRSVGTTTSSLRTSEDSAIDLRKSYNASMLESTQPPATAKCRNLEQSSSDSEESESDEELSEGEPKSNSRKRHSRDLDDDDDDELPLENVKPVEPKRSATGSPRRSATVRTPLTIRSGAKTPPRPIATAASSTGKETPVVDADLVSERSSKLKLKLTSVGQLRQLSLMERLQEHESFVITRTKAPKPPPSKRLVTVSESDDSDSDSDSAQSDADADKKPPVANGKPPQPTASVQPVPPTPASGKGDDEQQQQQKKPPATAAKPAADADKGKKTATKPPVKVEEKAPPKPKTPKPVGTPSARTRSTSDHKANGNLQVTKQASQPPAKVGSADPRNSVKKGGSAVPVVDTDTKSKVPMVKPAVKGKK